MGVRIRRAVPDDLAIVSELVAEYAEADGHDCDPAIARAGVEPLLADDRFGVIWSAVDDGADTADEADEHQIVVGCAAVTWGYSIEIGGFEVVLDEISAQRRGEDIGSRLIEHLEADCRQRGARRIFLETERPNDGARRLDTRHRFFVDDSIWMSKDLR